MMTTIHGTDSPSFLAVPAQARSRRSGLSGFIPLVGALLCRQCASCVSIHRVESDSSRYLVIAVAISLFSCACYLSSRHSLRCAKSYLSPARVMRASASG